MLNVVDRMGVSGLEPDLKILDDKIVLVSGALFWRGIEDVTV
jgi:hypothetical protein